MIEISEVHAQILSQAKACPKVEPRILILLSIRSSLLKSDTMPWPYISSRNSGSSKATTGTALDSIDGDRIHNDNDHAASVGRLSLSLEEEEEQVTTRRGASLDLPRVSLTALTPFTTSPANNEQKLKARRSSFPRLALPSWRQSSPSTSSPTKLKTSNLSSSPSSRSLRSATSRSRPTSLALDDALISDDLSEEGEGVELQEGYGTPYTANGLKGGFQCTTSPSNNNLSGSSSIASTSSSSRRSQSSNLFSLFSTSSASTRSSSDEYSLESPFQNEQIAGASKGRSSVEEREDSEADRRESPSKVAAVLPADSGFSEFGPHSIVEEEERRQSTSTANGHYQDRNTTYHPSTSAMPSIDDVDQDLHSRNALPTTSNEVIVTIPKKARSKGWFSFNSNTTSARSDIAAEDSTGTPGNERDTSLASSGAVSIAETHSTGSSNDTATAISTPVLPTSTTSSSISPPQMTTANSPNGKKGKPSTSSGKGFGLMRGAGRKRGDSEVSMKEMISLS